MSRFCLFLLWWVALPGWSGEVQVAVAANFYQPMKQLAAEFEQESGHQVQLSAGSTGALFAQISHGAPFDLFLAADQRRPSTLVKDGFAVASTQFTYAQGLLALWSPQEGLIDGTKDILSAQSIGRLALANPKTAPYGEAAMEVLSKLGLLQQLKGKLIQGKSISQTYQFVSSGSVPLGFVALSQVYHQGQLKSGSAWLVPETLHSPLKQDAVLLTQGASNPAAKALLTYLQSDKARALIKSFGYLTGSAKFPGKD